MNEYMLYADMTIQRVFSSNYNVLLDTDTKLHTARVCRLSIALAESLRFNKLSIIDIATGALLHDIGKLKLDQEILHKVSTLSRNERSIITLHPILGYQLIKEAKFNYIVKDIVLKHHEKLDGSGYPSKLFGNKIPYEVQVVTVADVFSALTEDRVYHRAFSLDDSIRILEETPGLNVAIVDTLKDLFNSCTLTLEVLDTAQF